MTNTNGHHHVLARPLVIFLLLSGLAGGSGTSKAQEWEYLGLPNSFITDIAVEDEDMIYASTYDYSNASNSGIFKTTNGGLTWDTSFSSAGTMRLAIHPRNPSVVYAGFGSIYGPPWGIIKTTDGGENWFHADSGLYMYGEYWIRSIEFDPERPETLYTGTSNGPFSKSTNGGVSWFPIGIGFFNSAHVIVFDPNSSDTIYAGDGEGSGLFKSTDGGTTWEETGLQVNGTPVNGLGIDPVNTNILYAGLGYYGFFRSTDAGETWEEVTSGLPTNTAGGSIVVNRITREVFAVAFPYDGGLFKSTDLGLTWERVEGLPTPPWPSALTISPDQTQLYVGLFDNQGIYRTTILVSDVPNDVDPLPTRVTLLQNYPNPFNPSTTIRYGLPQKAHIKLEVFNVLGQSVEVLADGEQEPGYHSVTLESSRLASGLYLYRIEAGDFVETKKLIILR